MVLCAWSLLASLALAAVTQLALGNSTPQRLEHDQLGAVASENSICSRIGIELLKAGGNAADAVSLLAMRLKGWKLITRAACWDCVLRRRDWYDSPVFPKRG